VPPPMFFGWRSWFSSDRVHCPRVCGCVKSQTCANGCAIVSSAKNLRRARVNLHPCRYNRPTLMPPRARWRRRKRTRRKSKCLRHPKLRGRRKSCRKRLRPLPLSPNVWVLKEQTRAAGAAGVEAGGEEVGRDRRRPCHPAETRPSLSPRVTLRRQWRRRR
jgi:hypothetical protein